MQVLEIKLASASPLSILLAGNNLARLLGGLAVTVRISLIAVALSLPLGVLFGLLMTRENRVIKLLSRIYLDFIRIMPQLVLLFLVFFGSARVFGLSLSGEFSAVLVFTLWGTAEMGDLVRGALKSISKHQYESAAALGLTAGQCSRYVIIPQTLRRLLPLAINLVTRMVKTTSDCPDRCGRGFKDRTTNHRRQPLSVSHGSAADLRRHFSLIFPGVLAGIHAGALLGTALGSLNAA